MINSNNSDDKNKNKNDTVGEQRNINETFIQADNQNFNIGDTTKTSSSNLGLLKSNISVPFQPKTAANISTNLPPLAEQCSRQISGIQSPINNLIREAYNVEYCSNELTRNDTESVISCLNLDPRNSLFYPFCETFLKSERNLSSRCLDKGIDVDDNTPIVVEEQQNPSFKTQQDELNNMMFIGTNVNTDNKSKNTMIDNPKFSNQGQNNARNFDNTSNMVEEYQRLHSTRLSVLGRINTAINKNNRALKNMTKSQNASKNNFDGNSNRIEGKNRHGGIRQNLFHKTKKNETINSSEVDINKENECNFDGKEDNSAGDGNENFNGGGEILIMKPQFSLNNFEEEFYRWILIPGSRLYSIWKIIQMFLMLWIVIPYPIVITFNVQFDAFVLLLNILIGLDILVLFRTAYRKSQTEELICDPIPIAKRYLRTQFSFDVATIFPQFLIWPNVRLVRFTLVIRIIKLPLYLPDLHTSRVLTRFQSGVYRFCKLIVSIIVIAHVVACVQMQIGQTYSDSQFVDFGSVEFPISSIYARALYWSYTTLTTVGYGDVVPNNDKERIFTSFIMVVGVTFYAYITATSVSIIQAQNAGAERRRERSESLSAFMADVKLPRKLRQMLKSHCQYEQGTKPHIYSAHKIMETLPSHLRRCIALQIYRETIQSTPFFHKKSEQFVASIVTHLRPVKFRCGEKIAVEGDLTQEWFILRSGLAQAVDTRNNQTLIKYHSGSTFGEIGILIKRRQLWDIIALTSCELLVLSRKNFMSITYEFPQIRFELVSSAVKKLNIVEKLRASSFLSPLETGDNAYLAPDDGLVDAFCNTTPNDTVKNLHEYSHIISKECSEDKRPKETSLSRSRTISSTLNSAKSLHTKPTLTSKDLPDQFHPISIDANMNLEDQKESQIEPLLNLPLTSTTSQDDYNQNIEALDNSLKNVSITPLKQSGISDLSNEPLSAPVLFDNSSNKSNFDNRNIYCDTFQNNLINNSVSNLANSTICSNDDSNLQTSSSICTEFNTSSSTSEMLLSSSQQVFFETTDEKQQNIRSYVTAPCSDGAKPLATSFTDNKISLSGLQRQVNSIEGEISETNRKLDALFALISDNNRRLASYGFTLH